MSNQKIAAKSDLISKADRATYDACTSVAAKVRFLTSLGHNRGDISRYMTLAEGREIRYQWVRNVQLTPLKKSN